MKDSTRWEIALLVAQGLQARDIKKKFPDITTDQIYSVISPLIPLKKRGNDELNFENTELKNKIKSHLSTIQAQQRDIEELQKIVHVADWEKDPRTVELKRHLEYYKGESMELLKKGHQVFMNDKTIRVVIPRSMASSDKKQMHKKLVSLMKQFNAIPCHEQITEKTIKWEFEIEE